MKFGGGEGERDEDKEAQGGQTAALGPTNSSSRPLIPSVPIILTCFARPTQLGNTEVGLGSPASPALSTPDPCEVGTVRQSRSRDEVNPVDCSVCVFVCGGGGRECEKEYWVEKRGDVCVRRAPHTHTHTHTLNNIKDVTLIFNDAEV
jgi:hypothetical protein